MKKKWNEKKKEKLKKMKKNVYIVRTRTYYMTPLFLQSDWIIGRKWRLVIGSISSDMIGWY
jgi:hypothetical protein